ncbi:glucose-6-phosphate isomerase [Luteimonas sp. BDR2-5]|uniref:glucose-6-phosphate isomerase n=1 Tax=Proluteimonas luteida TaxID=2878685 RepID=UPI001E396A24|nr:glucose-6-phosphate isomerase [Luteimonas sp. BDR2-5]MCD9029969.1 glucose-6-phosphate isomerase [Luteimonas sp. BDR2-5]
MSAAAQRFESTLAPHARRLSTRRIADLVAADGARPHGYALRVGGLYASFARQRYDDAARDALLQLARDAQLPQAFRALFDGQTVNTSEQRPALHVALRSALSTAAVARDAHAQALEARTRMAALVAALEASDVTDIVNVGIGGSDLGPRLVVDALKDFGTGRFRVHFLTNVDGSDAQYILKGLDPARTAAILVSKTFGTQETLLNGAIVRDWLGGGERLYAVSANVPRAEAFGVAPGRVLPMWDWVGGRYSLWSSVGFSIALAIGMDGFEALLAGAADMDAHVLDAPLAANLPVLHALSGVWNRNALGLATHAVLPYDERLALLPAYLQQLVMESLGKSVTPEGAPAGVDTVPVLWGGPGTNSQHSFFQALHQGTQTVPADFIGVVTPDNPYAENHAALLSNLLAQTEALANGFSAEDPQKSYPGNRPSTLLLLDRLTPGSFGALVALYEHSVYAQSVLWGINAFDQWGVELGKRIAGELLPAVRGDDVAVADPVTRALLDEIRARRS